MLVQLTWVCDDDCSQNLDGGPTTTPGTFDLNKPMPDGFGIPDGWILSLKNEGNQEDGTPIPVIVHCPACIAVITATHDAWEADQALKDNLIAQATLDIARLQTNLPDLQTAIDNAQINVNAAQAEYDEESADVESKRLIAEETNNPVDIAAYEAALAVAGKANELLDLSTRKLDYAQFVLDGVNAQISSTEQTKADLIQAKEDAVEPPDTPVAFHREPKENPPQQPNPPPAPPPPPPEDPPA